MKKLFLILFLTSQYSFGQMIIDLDKEIVKVEFTRLPDRPDLSLMNSYSILFSSDEKTISQVGLSESEIENDVNLPGYKYLKDGSAELLYEITINPVQFISETIESKSTKQKNSSGIEETKYVYYIETKYAVPSYISLMNNYTGAVMTNFSFATNASPVTVKSNQFNSYEDAQTYQYSNYEDYKEKQLRKAYSNLFYNKINSIKSTYCYYPLTVDEVFWKIDNAKKPEYVEFNKQLFKTKIALEKLRYNEPVDAIKAELLPVMSYWANGAAKIKDNNKKNRKLKYAYLINLATTQYWLEIFDACEATCYQIIENNYDEEDGQNMIANLNLVKKQILANSMKSRHDNREAYQSTSRFEVELQTLPVSNNNITGTTPENQTVQKPAPPVFDPVQKTKKEIEKVKEILIKESMKDHK